MQETPKAIEKSVSLKTDLDHLIQDMKKTLDDLEIEYEEKPENKGLKKKIDRLTNELIRLEESYKKQQEEDQ